MPHRLRHKLLVAVLAACGFLAGGCEGFVLETAQSTFASFITTIVTAGINEALAP